MASWWDRLVTAEPRLGASIAAGVSGVAAIVLIVLAFRQLGSERRRLGRRSSSAPARAAPASRCPRWNSPCGATSNGQCPGVHTQSLTLTKRGDAWRVRLEAIMPAADLAGVRQRMAGLVAEDLRRAGGMRLDGLDVVVTGFAPARGGR